MFKHYIVAVFFFMLPSLIYAQNYIKPIILSKTFETFFANDANFGKPLQIIKGAEDECNGGFYPDENRYSSFTILDDGFISEVMMRPGNGVLFYGRKLDANTTEMAFLKQFKGKYEPHYEIENAYDAEDGKNMYSTITFYFEHGKLQRYTLWMDNC